MEQEYLVIISSHSQAVFLYNELIKKECNVRIASAPCTLANGCSKCIKFTEKDMNIILEEINKNKIRTKGVYKIVISHSGETKYVKIKGPED